MTKRNDSGARCSRYARQRREQRGYEKPVCPDYTVTS